MQSSIYLGKRLLLITKNRYLKLVILVLFYFFFQFLPAKRQESGVIEILPEICI